MRTSKEYIQSLQRMRWNVYRDGQKVPHDHDAFMPAITVMSKTFDFATDPEFEPLLTTTSHISGKKINRFCHIHQTKEDLMTRRELTRKFYTTLGTCIQRCGGADSMNALSIVTYDVDKKYGTEYHKHWLKFLEKWQEEDLVAPITMTDVKGDRSKRPHQQADPDMYLHIVEKKSDGIVVRGAKNCNSQASLGNIIIPSPTRALLKEEADWAVSFWLPADWEGIKMCCFGMPMGAKRKHMPAPYAEFGKSDSFTIFDNVFVPWENVFLCGEVEFAPMLGYLTAIYHRFNYSGCKPALTDVMIGLAALAAEYNGVEKTLPIREKLAELIALSVLIDAAGQAAGLQSWQHDCGTWVPGGVPTHAARYLAGTHIFREYEIVTDIAGGLGACLPLEGEFFNPETGPLLLKYIKRRADIPAEYIHKLWRYIQDTIAGGITGFRQSGELHGGGSPIMEAIGMVGQFDIEARKNMVKRHCGIPVEEKPKQHWRYPIIGYPGNYLVEG